MRDCGGRDILEFAARQEDVSQVASLRPAPVGEKLHEAPYEGQVRLHRAVGLASPIGRDFKQRHHEN